MTFILIENDPSFYTSKKKTRPCLTNLMLFLDNPCMLNFYLVPQKALFQILLITFGIHFYISGTSVK